jgi:hypothetical protein
MCELVSIHSLKLITMIGPTCRPWVAIRKEHGFNPFKTQASLSIPMFCYQTPCNCMHSATCVSGMQSFRPVLCHTIKSVDWALTPKSLPGIQQPERSFVIGFAYW